MTSPNAWYGPDRRRAPSEQSAPSTWTSRARATSPWAPKRIVYLHQYFKTPTESGGTRSHAFATRLVNSGHEVHMITSDRRSGAVSRTEIIDGINVHWLPVRYENDMRVPRRMISFLAYAVRASRKARQLKADVVLATSTPLTVAIPAIYATVYRKTPMVFEVRDLWPDVPIAMGALRNPLFRGAARLLERTSYERSARIIVLSDGMRDGVIRRGVPANRIAVIPNACDVDLFGDSAAAGQAFRNSHAWLGNRPLVVYTGTLGRANGVSEFVLTASAALAVAPDVRFLVVGAGAEEEKLRALAVRCGVLDQNFFMIPSRPKAEMPAILAAANIATSYFLPLPVLATTSPNKVFDAFAAGTPVATSSGGWLRDLLEASGAGLSLSRDTTSAATVLCEAVQNADWNLAASAAARGLAHQYFERGALYDAFEDALCGPVRADI